MSNQSQSYLRFSLEEAIWFPEGYEVSELYSLSIEPDVNVTERNEYVVIEGTLDVSGEYRGNAGESPSVEQSDLQVQQRYVHSVERRNPDGMLVFNHSFPVDISIPANRVEDRRLVEIDISSFDYTMPERKCLNLMAELQITGIYDSVQRTTNKTEEEESIAIPVESFHLQREESYLNESLQIPKEESVQGSIHLQREESYLNESLQIPKEESVQESIHLQREDSYLEKSLQVPKEESVQESIHLQREESYLEESLQVPKEESIQESMHLQREESYLNESLQLSKEESTYEESLQLQKEESYINDTPSLSREESVLNPMSKEESMQQESLQYAHIDPITKPGVESATVPESFAASAYTEPREESSYYEEKVEVPVGDKQASSFQSLFSIPMPTFSRPGMPSASTYMAPQVVENSMHQLAEGTRNEENSLFSHKEEIENSSTSEAEVTKSSSHTKTISLTDFFGKKDSQTHTKLKVCIVQSGDTLSELASRYEVSRIDLITLNSLESESDITEGQVLYIPKKTVHR